MDLARNNALSIQKHLRPQKPVEIVINRETRKLPLDDPGEPYQCTYIIEPDRPETLPSIENFKTSLGEPIHRDLQILIRKWQISLTTEKFYQLPVIFRTHLRGDEQSARFQHPVDLSGIEISMAVDHHIKGCIFKGQHTLTIRSPEINSKRQQCLLAQVHVGWIVLSCRSVLVGMVQR